MSVATLTEVLPDEFISLYELIRNEIDRGFELFSINNGNYLTSDLAK